MTRARLSPYIDVAYVARPHGVRGEIRAVPYDPESSTLAEVPRVHVGGERIEIVHARRVQGAFLLVLSGIQTRDDAERLRDKVISVERELLALEDGEVFLSDLVGCDVFLADGTGYGQIAAIEPGFQDRLVIHDGDIERLLPLVPEFVVSIDVEEGRVIVTPPEDLPEERRR